MGEDQSQCEKVELPKVLSRFTRLETLFEMIELGGIPLRGPDRWDDICDKAFFERGCRDTGSRCGVVCLTGVDLQNADENGVFPKETSAHWKIYAGEPVIDNPMNCFNIGIRIDFNGEKLKTLTGIPNDKFEIRRMHYVGHSEYLSAAQGLNDNPEACGGAKEWLFLKREAYLWENEWRLVSFAEPQDAQFSKRDKSIRGFVPVGTSDVEWKDLIKGIVFSPCCTLKNSSRRAEIELLRECARSALNLYVLGHDCWTEGKKDLVNRYINESYRSGVLDNKSILAAVWKRENSIKQA